MSERKLRIGVAGMGRAFTLMLPTLVGDPRIELVAAADPLAAPREKFAKDFSPRTYRTVAELCDDPEVEIVYIASPHQYHAEHAELAAAKGKHLLIEKPMALNLADCRRMIAGAKLSNVHLIVGHSHSFDAPILRTRQIIAGGDVGKVHMIHALNFTDFLYRPRRPEELNTEDGGGVVFSQAAHQIDCIRLLGGGRVRSVRAATGAWDRQRPTEGAFSALLTFEDGAFATTSYSGYAHFDSDEFCDWIGESGKRKDRDRYGAARQALAKVKSVEEEAALKAARNYGAPSYAPDAPNSAPHEPSSHQHFGLMLVSCDHADLRPMPNGVMIYANTEQRFEPLSEPSVPRSEVIDELYDAVVHNRAPLHGGAWSLATMEVCLAILQSAREQREITLEHQIGVED